MPRIHPTLCTCPRCEPDPPIGGDALDRFLTALVSLGLAGLLIRAFV